MTAFTASVAESINPFDGYSSTAVQTVAVAETMTLADAADGGFVYTASVAEAIALMDGWAAGFAYIKSVAETMTLVDTVSGPGAFNVSLEETYDFIDRISSIATLHVSVAETIVLFDLTGCGTPYFASVNEAMSLADTVGPQAPPGTYNYFFQFDSEYLARTDPIVGPYFAPPGNEAIQQLYMVDTRNNQYQPGCWVMLGFDAPLKNDLLASPNLRLLVNVTLLASSKSSIWFTNMNLELLNNLQVVGIYSGAIYPYNGLH